MSAETQGEKALALLGVARRAHDDAYAEKTLDEVLVEAEADLRDIYGVCARVELQSGHDGENLALIWRAYARIPGVAIGRRSSLVLWRRTDWHPDAKKAASELAWFLWAQARPSTFPMREGRSE